MFRLKAFIEDRNRGPLLLYWMPDRACPQLDWGSGMTGSNKTLVIASDKNVK